MEKGNVILELGGGVTAPSDLEPKHTNLETFIVYSYFCLKLGCSQSFFGRDKGVIKNCPNCGLNDEVVSRFE